MKMNDEKFPFEMYNVSGDGCLIPARFHPVSMEIVEVTQGKVSVRIGTEVFDAAKGDFLFVPQKMIFRVTASEGAAAVRGMIFDSYLVESDMENFDTEVLGMFYIQSENKITVFRKESPVYPVLRRSMDGLWEEYVAKDLCYKLPIRAEIYLMITALLRTYCGSKNELDRMVYHNVMRLRPVISYIRDHVGGKIYIEELSGMLSVSPDYFTKMFKDSIGKTPIDYINGVRVNRAMQLLIETEAPMSEISEQVGFSNPNYFHKIFKQYIGVGPLAYRKDPTL